MDLELDYTKEELEAYTKQRLKGGGKENSGLDQKGKSNPVGAK